MSRLISKCRVVFVREREVPIYRQGVPTPFHETVWEFVNELTTFRLWRRFSSRREVPPIMPEVGTEFVATVEFIPLDPDSNRFCCKVLRFDAPRTNRKAGSPGG